MSRKRTSQNNTTKKIHRERDTISWRYCLLTLVCGLFLVGGFFVAARQHFSSIDFSIKNSRLKKQIEELEADKRRFTLAKEIALTPSEIKKAAKKIGLTDMTASNIEVYRPVSDSADRQQPEKDTDSKPKQSVEKPAKNTVAKDEKTSRVTTTGKESSNVKIAKKKA